MATLYEYYNTGDTQAAFFSGVGWHAQTFTTGSVGHTVTSVRLKLCGYGSPGTVTISIRATTPRASDGAKMPTGSDLASGTLTGTLLADPGSWLEIFLTPEITLSPNTTYAIIIRAPSANGTSSGVGRRIETTVAYAGGMFWYSNDSGVTWDYIGPTWESMFEVWGNSTGSGPTLLLSESFETSAWPSTWTLYAYGGGLTPSIQSTTKWLGTYAAKFSLGATAGYSVAVRLLPATYTTVYCRAYVRFTASPTVGNWLMTGPNVCDANGHDAVAAIVVNQGGTLVWGVRYTVNGPTTYYTAGSTIVKPNQWYLVEVAVTVGAGTGVATVYVNNIKVAETTGLTNSNIVPYQVQIGTDAVTALAADVYTDEVAAATSQIGGTVPPDEGPAVGYLLVNAYQDTTRIAATVSVNGASGATTTSAGALFSIAPGTYTVTASYGTPAETHSQSGVVITTSNDSSHPFIVNLYFVAITPLVVSAGGPYSAHMTNPIVQFTSSVSGGTLPYTYHWNFGDGGTSMLPNPSHTYPSTGATPETFTATLTVTDSSSPAQTNSPPATASVDISPLLPPVAVIGVSAQPYYVNTAITFNGSGSHPSESGATIPSNGYYWDFGDGTNSTAISVNKTYGSPNTYTVSLRVTDSNGLTNTATTTIVVAQQPNWTLNISASVGGSVNPSGNKTYTTGSPSDVVTETRARTYVFDQWYFDNSPTGVKTTTYQVLAQAPGTSHTLMANFVPASPVVAHANGPYYVTAANPTVNFQGNASGGVPPYTYLWTFGDGQSSISQNPSHSYTLPGPYYPRFTATDVDGISASEDTSVTISAHIAPIANFTFSPASPFDSQQTTFDGSTSTIGDPGTITAYNWVFDDGTTDSGGMVLHAFAKGTHIVKLTVIETYPDTTTLSNTKSQSVTVQPKPKHHIIVQAGPNGTTNPAPSTYDIDYDQDFAVTAQPGMHYELDYWDRGNGLHSTNYTQTIPASTTPVEGTYLASAYFKPIIWTLSYVPDSIIIGNPPGQYQDGTPISLSANPPTGYMFDPVNGWAVNGTSGDTANPLKFTMDKNYTISVSFVTIPSYTISGIVQDTAGNPLADVKVSAEGTAYTTQTIANGTFILPVAQGDSYTYTLDFEKAGYTTVKIADVGPVTGNMQLTNPVTIAASPTPRPYWLILLAIGGLVAVNV